MKILMLLDTEFPPDIRVENEAQSLIDAGHEVHILSYNFDSKTSSEVFKGSYSGIKSIELNSKQEC